MNQPTNESTSQIANQITIDNKPKKPTNQSTNESTSQLANQITIDNKPKNRPTNQPMNQLASSPTK